MGFISNVSAVSSSDVKNVLNGYEIQTHETGLVESDTVAKLCNYSLMGSFFKQHWKRPRKLRF